MIATRSSPPPTPRSSQPRPCRSAQRRLRLSAVSGRMPQMPLGLPSAPRALGAERRAEILAALRAHGKVRAADLVASLDVSIDTVRRDLDELARAGMLRRVHGGALPRGPETGGHSARRGRDAPQKAAIARAAAGLVR